MQGTLRILYSSLSSLIAWPGNPKRHADHDLQSSIRRFGYTQPILIDETTGRMVAGHGRLAACQVLREAWLRDPGQHPPPAGIKVKGQQWLLPVLRGLSFVSEGEALAYVLADNQLTIAGGWDPPDLSAALRHLQGLEIPIADLGWAEDALKGALAGLASLGGGGPAGDAGGGSGGGGNDPGANIEKAASLQRKWKTAVGQCWVIPSLTVQDKAHRLIIGDSTKVDDVARVMGGDKADMILTDPPYCSGGFQEAGRASGSIGTRGEERIANDTLSSRGYSALIKSVLGNVSVGIVYIFTDWRMWSVLFDVVESSGFGVRNMIVWDKGTPGMGAGWRMQHELVMCGIRVKSPFDPKKAQGNVIQSSRTGNKLHPTEKPVDLLTRILTVTDMARTVFDPFAGSGTTIVAAEETQRICYGVEMSPAYVAVTLERLSGLGLMPRLEAP